MPGGAAFFDVDHTLIAGNTAALYVRYSARKRPPGPLARRAIDTFLTLYYYARYKVNWLDMDAVMTRSAASLAGREVEEFRDFCRRFVAEEVLPLVYPEVRAAIEGHRGAGDAVALVSASIDPVIEPIARALGLDAALATGLEVKDGRITGGWVRPACYGPGKIVYAERFCAERGLDLKSCHFYTDSASDLPLLERVGFPRPVNPDFLLRREAARRRWPVAVFGRARANTLP